MKKLICLIAAFVVILSLTACKGQNEAEASEKSTKEQATSSDVSKSLEPKLKQITAEDENIKATPHKDRL